MKLIWEISESDVAAVRHLIASQDNPFVHARVVRNVLRQGIVVSRETIWREIVMCLLTTQQRSGPDTPVTMFLTQIPFPLRYDVVKKESDNLSRFAQQLFSENGLNRYKNKLPDFIVTNYTYLESTTWKLFEGIEKRLTENSARKDEQEVASEVMHLKGFGPKQARNLLQALGLTRYEIPIDSRIATWLNRFGFPIKVSSAGLQDLAYYDFISDAINLLCEKAGVLPCVLDAAVFSSFDNGGWTDENVIY
jgi:thermostable 8-oxoguanine DNA glycosylase